MLNALEEKGISPENTLFVMMSYHGDSMAARGRVTKQVDFYEETMRVPLIFKGPGIAPGKRTGIAALLDLFPTLCAQAGITPPENLQGIDLSPALNLAKNPESIHILQQMQGFLKRHLETTNDPFEALPWTANPRLRSHPAGYQNHQGTVTASEG